jgi:hypothetical protein
MSKNSSRSISLYKKHQADEHKYRIHDEDILRDEENDPIAILDPKGTPICRKDVMSERCVTQHMSIRNEKCARFWVDIGDRKKLRRNYFRITNLVMMFFGIYPRDSGDITFKLVNKSYKEVSKSIEFEGKGSVGSVWILSGSMDGSVHKEDIDNLQLEVCVFNSDIENVILGEMVILSRFLWTDRPMIEEKQKTYQAEINPIIHDGSAGKCMEAVLNLCRRIVKEKSKWKELNDFILNRASCIASEAIPKVDISPSTSSVDKERAEALTRLPSSLWPPYAKREI